MIHAEDKDLKLILKGQLDENKTAEILSHLSVCDSCSEKFADLTLQMATVTPPSGMYEEVISAAAKEKSIKQKKAEILFLYSLRVVTGVCAAIILMCSGYFEFLVDEGFDVSRMHSTSESISEHLNEGISNISDALFKREVFKQ